MTGGGHRSIGEVLSLLQEEFPDVTISKIRFLESQGLIQPERTAAGYRKFYEDDIERLRWVLRQQRDHFLPLRVIRTMLEDGVDRYDPARGDQPTLFTPVSEPEPDDEDGQLVHAGGPAGSGAPRSPAHPAVASAPPARAAAGAARAGAAPSRRAARSGTGSSTAAAAGQPVADGGPTRSGPPTSRAPGAAGGAAGGPAGPSGTVGQAARESGGAPVGGDEGVGGAGGQRSGGPPAGGRSGGAGREPAPGPHAGAEDPSAAAASGTRGPNADAGAGSGSTGPSGDTPSGPPADDRSAGRRGRLETPADVVAALQEDPRGRRPAGRRGPGGRPGAEPPADASPPPAGAAVHAGALPQDERRELTADELCDECGIDRDVLAGLERFGLVVATDRAGEPLYDADALGVARVAARYVRLGVEPRHLRMYLVSAEREAGFVEQLVTPLLKQRNPEARGQAGELADELAAMGAELHARLLRRELRPGLGR